MIELQLRDEFRGKKLKGTTVDFTNQSQTGALQQNAKDFLADNLPVVRFAQDHRGNKPWAIAAASSYRISWSRKIALNGGVVSSLHEPR